MFGAIAVLAVVPGWMSPTRASAAAAVTVEAGYAGTFVPGQPAPVRVRVTADRLLSGELQVVLNGLPTSVAVEVPGGTTKDFLVVLPTSAIAHAPLTVTARLPDGSKQPPAATASMSPLGEQEVVGLFPGALGGRSLPGTAPLAVDVGTAKFVALGPLEIERAPDSLAALATIGVGADELVRQAPSVREGLLRWVEDGGRLLVDAPLGAPVAGLPDAWQPAGNGRAQAGAGEIRLTDGAMAGGRWAGLVEPTARSGGGGVDFPSGPPLGDLLAGEAGFRVPRISWLVAFLVVYIAAVGPVLYVLLRRRRRPELAWVAIPLIAVVFTAASYAGGRTLRDATPVVHATVVSTGAHGSTAFTNVGVSSRSGGTARLRYPTGWLAGGGTDGWAPASGLSQVSATESGGVEGRLPLEAGQFALVTARGPADIDGALEVVASSDVDGFAKGTVRNGTPFDLDDVAVVVGERATRLGPLAAGKMQEWTLQGAGVRPDGGPPLAFTLWGSTGPDALAREGMLSMALFDSARRAGVPQPNGGLAVALGRTRHYQPPVTVGGREDRPEGQTLVLGSGTVTPTGGRATDVSVHAEMVRTPAAGGAAVVRFGLPTLDHTVDSAKLVLRTPNANAEVWTAAGWTAVPCSGPACPGPANVQVRCPPGVACPAPPLLAPPFPVMGAGTQDLTLPAGAVWRDAVYVRLAGGIPMRQPGAISVSLRETA